MPQNFNQSVISTNVLIESKAFKTKLFNEYVIEVNLQKDPDFKAKRSIKSTFNQMLDKVKLI